MLSNKDKAIEVGIKDQATIARFKSKLKQMPNGCIEYTGYRTAKGYGYFKVGVNPTWASVRAHRFSFALAYGIDKLPSGTDKTQKRKVIHHKCENKACVNPLHLEPVTDNWNLGRVNDKNMF